MQGAVKLPDDTTVIGDEAFLNCTTVTSIEIPVNVTRIGTRAFYGCNGLKDVFYDGTAEDWDDIAIETGNGPLTRATVHCVIDYGTCGADGDNLYWVLHEDGKLEILGSGAMADYSDGTAPWYNKRLSITALTIGNGVSRIGSSAFYNCSMLTALTIPESVVSLGSSAFANCINMKKVTAPANVVNMKKVTVPANVTSIDARAFYGCKNLMSVRVPVSVTHIGNCAFYECTGLKNVYYSGTTAEWDNVVIETGNDPLSRATIHCTDCGWEFERKIEIVCPWGLGGGADSTIRPMATLLQNELGVPVEVRNETGGSGVTGATYAYKQPADGYTFLLGTQSLFIQDMMDNMDFNFKDEFECEDVLVHSINMLAGSKKQMDKYGVKTFSDLKEYAAAHPYEVSVAMLTATGVDGMCFEIATEGLALNPKSYQGGSEVNSDMAGGHVDLAVGGYDDMTDRVRRHHPPARLLRAPHRHHARLRVHR